MSKIVAEQSEWLKRIVSGIQGGRLVSIVIEGEKFAVVKSPGGNWYDTGGKHYGSVSWDLVKKDGDGLVRDGFMLKSGGRVRKAIIEVWKKVIKDLDSGDLEFDSLREEYRYV